MAKIKNVERASDVQRRIMNAPALSNSDPHMGELADKLHATGDVVRKTAKAFNSFNPIANLSKAAKALKDQQR